MFATTTQKMTYQQAFDNVKKIAAFMRDLGVMPGQSVALQLPATLHLLFLEAVFHEAAISFMLPSSRAALANMKPDWLFTSHADSPAGAEQKILIDSPTLQKIAAQTLVNSPKEYASIHSICRLVFSSGTTGTPKPVAFSVQMIESRAKAAASVWMHTKPFMTLLDVGTVSGFQSFYSSIVNGWPYLVPGDASTNLKQLELGKVAAIKGSPVQLGEIADELEATNKTLPDLKVIQHAGSVMPGKIAERLRRLTGATLHNLYGATEVGTIAARRYDSDDPFDLGEITPGTTVEIVDEQRQPVGVGQVGALRFKRAIMAHEYFEAPEPSAIFFDDGWFYPGDLARFTADKKLFLAGRESEIINAGGLKIDPAIIDEFALAQPGVVDAAAFGYEGTSGLTQLGLAVVVEPKFDFSKFVDSLKLGLKNLAPNAVVEVSAVPRSPMGKPLRLELAQSAF
ncbi:MAG: hypothetical protein RL196_174 [Actinomycetota bacterium]